MKTFGQNKAVIYVKHDEHANLHSLPFRYGFYFDANEKLEIYNCRDWLKEHHEGEQRIKVLANFRNLNGDECEGIFTLLDNKQQYLKLVTVWDNTDHWAEQGLSNRIRTLCDNGILSREDLISLHPKYAAGDIRNVDQLVAESIKLTKIPQEDVNEIIAQNISEEGQKIKVEIKDEISEAIKEEIRDTFSQQIGEIGETLNKVIELVSKSSDKIIADRHNDNTDKKEVVTPRKIVARNFEVKPTIFPQNGKIFKIYGPPGTGKTTTLINLVKKHVEAGVKTNEIGFFSFTNFSTKVALERIAEAFPSLDIETDFPGFRTLHSLAYKSLLGSVEILDREQAKEFDANMRIEEVMMEEDDISSIVYRVKHPVVDAAAIARSRLISFEDHLRNTTRADSYFLNEWLGYPYSNRHVPVREVDYTRLFDYINKYEAYKTSLNVIDYTSILELSLHEDCQLPEYKVIFIDEAQDLSELQWEIAKRLFDKAEVAYIAGDDDQAICESFGASPDTFVTFPAEEEIVLSQSFRVPKSNQIGIMKDGTVSVLNERFQRKEKDWLPSSGADGWYGNVGRSDLVNLIKSYEKKDWLIMAASHKTLSKLSDYLLDNGIQHFLSNKLVPEVRNELIPTIRLATIWGAKGGEADITAFLRDEDIDERMLKDDPRLTYVANTRSKAVHLNVKKQRVNNTAEVERFICELPDIRRTRETTDDYYIDESPIDEIIGSAVSNDLSLNELISSINKPPYQKASYVGNSAKLVAVNLVKRGRRECVEIVLDDGSQRAKMWDVNNTFEVCRKLVGHKVITDVANPRKNNQFEWFNNIYLADD